MNCNICRAGMEGDEWTDAVVLGKKTPSQAAHKFGMSVEDVMMHIYEHSIMNCVTDEDRAAAQGRVGEEPGLISMDFYTTELMQILAYLKRYSRGLSIHQSSSTRDVELAIKIMRELRLTIESFAEFQGRIDTKSHTTINIDNMNMKFLSITNVIRTKLCPKCRQEMLTAITELDGNKLPQTQTITPEIISSTLQQ